jgi:signal transduction histidine kinase
VLPTVNRVFQWLQAWGEYPQRQAALIRKIVDRIRDSLELQVVLKTAVDEVAALLVLDCCSFLWYFKDTQRVQVVCEQSTDFQKTSHLGYHPLENFGAVAPALAAGKLTINRGTLRSKPRGLGRIFQQLFWMISGREQQVKPLQSRKPQLPSYLKQKRPLTGNQKIFGYEASLLIPVTSDEGGIGFIACFSEQPRRWSAAEIEFLKSIAEPLEIAIRQAKLYEQTQKQALRERLVNHIINRTRQSFDMETILTEVSQELLEAMQADRCLVHLVEDGNNPEIVERHPEGAIASSSGDTFRRKHLYEACRPPFSPSIACFDTNGPITQWVIQHQQLVVIPDIAQDERIREIDAEYQKAQIKSSLVVPVQAHGTLHALLYLNQCSHIRYWSKNDCQLAQAVADQLAISLQQAYLYARTQQQAAQSERQAQKMAQMLEELQLTQAQLIQTEKMSSLGRMVAGVAHEINNPINFIYGNIPYIKNYVNDLLRLVQAYKSKYPYPDSELQELVEETEIDFLLRDLPKILQSMQTGAERIHEIVGLLQKFSRQNQASVKAIDLNAALESTLLILHNQIAGTIQLERDYKNLPPVECYAKPINHVLLNILTNAIEALNRWPNPNKKITLHTKWIASNEIGNPGRVQVAIRDNGPGIEQENQSRIFEPFFTTKDVGQGRGLGLTVSYQTIVNQHHGQLNVISKPGQGAEFILEIPLRHSKALASDLSCPTSMAMEAHQKNAALQEHSSGFGTTETNSLRPNTEPIAAVTNSGC